MKVMHSTADIQAGATTPAMPRKKLLILVVAFGAESTITNVLYRIPECLNQRYCVEVLVIDDSSSDATFEKALDVKHNDDFPFVINVLYNPENQGYGGNQKIGYQYAIQNEFDFVAMLHGDGQYAPEFLENLLEPLSQGDAEAVFGSRMMTNGAALEGGMPYYKFFGNKALTWFENKILGTNLTEFHSGYRLYSVEALSKLPFRFNTNDFHFDTEIIIQFVLAGYRIFELPIPTYYGEEVCHVNVLKYARDVVFSVLRARAQSTGLCYARRFDCASENPGYTLKLGYPSTHTALLEKIPHGSRVLDLGCAGGYVGEVLRRQRGCYVVGVDVNPLPCGLVLDNFYQVDLNSRLPEIDWAEFDYVLLLDVIEHLRYPEKFVQDLYAVLGNLPNTEIIVSTGNVAFLIPRIMLLFGQFNYGKRGILDLTHYRLFTFNSFRALFLQHGFVLESEQGIPAPFPLAVGNRLLGRLLLVVNKLAIRICKGLFSYQIFMVLRAKPSIELLLQRSITASSIRTNESP